MNLHAGARARIWFSLAAAAAVVTYGIGTGEVSAAPDVPADVNFTKHIAPILQRSCENCHRPDGVAPMSLVTYEDVRPWARAIKQRTGIGPHAGVMPPWYVEKNIGIQQFLNDPSLSDDEIAMIAKWADSGAPRGNPADMPPPRVYADGIQEVKQRSVKAGETVTFVSEVKDDGIRMGTLRLRP